MVSRKPKRRSAIGWKAASSRTQELKGASILPQDERLVPGVGGSRPKRRTPPMKFRWAEAVSAEDWEIYSHAIKILRDAGVSFMLGGGFALATFTGRWRDTKDIDFYIHPRDRMRAAAAVARAGFKDYFETKQYDRKWIYRSTRNGLIVDLIWAMANQRAQVDDLWFERATSIQIRGEDLKVLPMEEFMWCKLYIMQRDHCDWTDVFNLLYAIGPRLDWAHVI